MMAGIWMLQLLRAIIMIGEELARCYVEQREQKRE